MKKRIASSENELDQDVYPNAKRIWVFRIKVDVVVGEFETKSFVKGKARYRWNNRRPNRNRWGPAAASTLVVLLLSFLLYFKKALLPGLWVGSIEEWLKFNSRQPDLCPNRGLIGTSIATVESLSGLLIGVVIILLFTEW